MIEESEDRVMKHCKKCDSHKPLAEFSVSRGRKDGRQVYCKACNKVSQVKYYKHNKAKAHACVKAWRAKNLEAARENERAWYARNKEKVIARKKAWAKANPDAVREAVQVWREKNTHRVLAFNAKRRSAQLLRTPGWLTEQDFDAMEFIYAWAKVLEASTGIPHHVDHIYPLQGRFVSGLHVPANLQVLTASENCSKSNMWVPQ